MNLIEKIAQVQPLVMGILNVTPDSFSDGQIYMDTDIALAHALEMARHGADIIDIGGESTRPGSLRVHADEQIRRIVPVIKAIRAKSDIDISVDTTSATVALQALEAGATLINDISALEDDPALADIAVRYKCPIILMHKQGSPANMQDKPIYTDPLAEISLYLKERANYAISRGINPDNIIIDPGIGFGKTLEHNLALIANLAEFKKLGYPILLGASRKSFIGKLLDINNPQDRIFGDAAVTAWAVNAKVDIIRVHEVKPAVDVIKTTRALLNAVR